MTKAQHKKLLRVCKDFLKLSHFCKMNNVSGSAISKFVNSNQFDDYISINTLNEITDTIYNTCSFITDYIDDLKKVA